MFTMQLKTKLVILTILFTLLFNTFLFSECDMMAMIAKKGHSIAWINGSESSWETPNDPHDYFKFLYDRSPYNPDGYGIIYIDYVGYIPEINYPDVIEYPTLFNDVSNQAWYVIPNETMGNYTISIYDGPYENAKSEILESSNEVGVVLGHVRNATGTAIGNHPFQIICDVNDDGIDETFMFMHNGNVTNMVSAFRADIIEMYGLEWFTNNQSNWKGDPNSADDWIDSEMYFHYLIAHVKNANGNVMKGIYNALGNINREYEYGITINTGMYDNNVNGNFVMTDGENLYLYRNCNDNGHSLAFDEYDSGFWGVQTSNTHGQFEQMAQNSFVIISPYGTPTVMNNFLFPDIYYNYPVYCSYNQYNFISGEIDNNTQDLNIYYSKTYISGNTFVNAGHTLDIEPETVGGTPFNPEIKFAGHHTLTINGTVNIHEDASLNLSNSSSVEILNNGVLFLDWGSTITGSTPTTYEATPPGQQVGGEDAIPGDRIIAKNGGKITTNTESEYITDPGPEITIGSGLPEGEECRWDGIFIQNPSAEANYWLVNCDISWINKLSIENVGLSSKNTANLKLYQTDFCHSGQIVARDGHLLYIHGSEENMCYIQENTPIPITAYESPVDISYCWIGGFEENDGLENGGGIYLYDSANQLSSIENTHVVYNNDDGLMIDNAVFGGFNNNSIENNAGFGMFCYYGTEFTGDDPFYNISICNNAYAEYAGWQSTFIMYEPDESIWIEDTDYGSGLDQYLLMDILWDGENPVDIIGTNLTFNDLPHLYPADSCAWTFSEEESEEKLMLYSASIDIGDEDYASAEQTLQQIIADYPLAEEAGIAVYYLYHLEGLTYQDFGELISYLENLTPESDTSLEKAIENVVTKSYMKEKEYLTAIDRLETIITNSQIPDEVIAAMIDEGYCYLELAEEELKASPSNCTVRTSTLEEYQAMVNELKHSFSFYAEETDHEVLHVSGNILSLNNFPNPFNCNTQIAFTLTFASDVSITIYNVKGQRVKQLMRSRVDAGSHTVTWNGMNSNNVESAPGIYFYKITAGGDSIVRKMFLIK